jgi:hypothetical protein
MYSPVAHAKIYGSTFVNQFVNAPILTIGKDTWSRQDMVALGVPNTVACGILSTIAKKVGVNSVKDFYEHTSPYTFSEYRAGVVTLFVLFAIFSDRGLDPAKWYKSSEKDALVGFHHFKRREALARERERKDARARRRATRRNAPVA